MKRPRKSMKALRKEFLERHKEWEASNNPQGIYSGTTRKTWRRRSVALMALVREGQKIRKAPKGKLRLVHVDARDHTPTPHGDYKDMAAVKEALKRMLHGQVLEMEVYDHKGKQVAVTWP